MDSDSECAAAAIVFAVLLKRRKKSKRKKRSAWVKPWLQKRTQLGIYDTLLQELRLEEEEDYKKFLRMSTETFDELLQLISNDIPQTSLCFKNTNEKLGLLHALCFSSLFSSCGSLCNLNYAIVNARTMHLFTRLSGAFDVNHD